MTAFIDTSVIMYAGGAAHPLRESCRAVLRMVADGALEATTSTEVVQEILHRFSRGDRAVGVRMADSTLTLFGELVSIDTLTMRRTVQWFTDEEGLSARAALHVATCVVHGLEPIVSVDTDFDRVAAVPRRHPRELAPTDG